MLACGGRGSLRAWRSDQILAARLSRELRRGLPGAAAPAILLRLAGRGWVVWEAAWLLAYAGTLVALCHQGGGPGFLPVLAVAVPALPVLVRLLAVATVRRRPAGPPVDAPRVRRLARWLVSGTFRASSTVLYLVLLAAPTKSSPWDDLLLLCSASASHGPPQPPRSATPPPRGAVERAPAHTTRQLSAL